MWNINFNPKPSSNGCDSSNSKTQMNKGESTQPKQKNFSVTKGEAYIQHPDNHPFKEFFDQVIEFAEKVKRSCNG